MLDYTNSVIYHDGIKGMRWGVRKYRNYDGTLTPAGKLRYGSDNGGLDSGKPKKMTRAEKKEAKAKTAKKEAEKAKKEAERAKKEAEEASKKLRKEREAYEAEKAERAKTETKERIEAQRLSNEELKSRIERLNLERQYSQLVNPPAPVRKSKAEKIKTFLSNAAGMAASAKSIYESYQAFDKVRHPEKYEKQDPLKSLRQQEEKERLKASIDKSKYDNETRARARAKWTSEDFSGINWSAPAWTDPSNSYSYKKRKEKVTKWANSNGILSLPAPSSANYLALPPGNPFAPPPSYYDKNKK